MKKYLLLFSTVAMLMVGCAHNATSTALESGTSQVQTRQMQSRVFDTNDKEKTLRTVIATLQDLGFVIDKADLTLGSITATKLDGYALKMSVTVRPRNEKQLLVRANAQFEEQAVTDPRTYQAFFTSFEKAMFLTAHEVD